jgi:hypothetical protein
MNTMFVLMILGSFGVSIYAHRGESRINRFIACLALTTTILFLAADYQPETASMTLQVMSSIALIAMWIDASWHAAYLAFGPKRALLPNNNPINKPEPAEDRYLDLGCFGESIHTIFGQRLDAYREHWKNGEVYFRFVVDSWALPISYNPTYQHLSPVRLEVEKFESLKKLLGSASHCDVCVHTTAYLNESPPAWFVQPKIELTHITYVEVVVRGVNFPRQPS